MLGKYNHVYFVLFFLVLFYLGLTADYTNIVASCVAIPIWTCKHKITGEVDKELNNMYVYDNYNELIQSTMMMKPFPVFPSVYWLVAIVVQTLSPPLIGTSMIVTSRPWEWCPGFCLLLSHWSCHPIPRVDGGTRTDIMTARGLWLLWVYSFVLFMSGETFHLALIQIFSSLFSFYCDEISCAISTPPSPQPPWDVALFPQFSGAWASYLLSPHLGRR